LCFNQRNAFAVKADDYVYRISTTAKHARIKANDHVPVFQQWLSIWAMKAFVFQQRGGAGLQACG